MEPNEVRGGATKEARADGEKRLQRVAHLSASDESKEAQAATQATLGPAPLRAL